VKTPALTVIMPAYNARAFIGEAIESVLAQTFADFELVIVDDGSTDDTLDVMRSFSDPRVRVLTQRNQGAGAARRAAMAAARAPIVACADADDISRPERFAIQKGFLDTHPDHVLVASQLALFDDATGEPLGRTTYVREDADIERRLLLFNPIPQPSVMFRMWAYREAGGYTATYPTAEDYDLWLRMHRLGRFHVLDEPLVDYRIHATQSKARSTKRQLLDTIFVKLKAGREYRYRWTVSTYAVLAAQVAALIVPAEWLVSTHRRLFYRR
jgi:glycosyltransferase involved in cell wall biosynthesis